MEKGSKVGFDVIIESPGRINLIGEHIDYNGGMVLPAAIDLKVKLYFKKNDSGICHVYSENYDSRFDIHLDKVRVGGQEWHNYFLGVIHFIQKKYPEKIKGFECVVESNLPIGSGVSSSAALECGIAKGLDALFDIGLTDMEIISVSRDAEHYFVGTKCGIMDQFAVVRGQLDKFIRLNCNDLSFDYVPANLEEYTILLLNTNVSHNLATSEYNLRRKECEKGLAIIQKEYPSYSSVAEIPKEVLHQFKTELDFKTFDRLFYVIDENQRTIDACAALKSKDLKKLGEKLYESHEGLRHRYEVSCEELDFLVDFSKDFEGVIGSRMMGGGFGGCTINLVHEDTFDEYIEVVSNSYKNKFNVDLTPLRVAIGDGVKRIK